ncbi:MAG TPA: hypothetical protein VN345_07475 [Blastocatellia bacterium]|nr:hypothetical protein [Blastocatellia bacterium]
MLELPDLVRDLENPWPWTAALAKTAAEEIAIDGKTVRRSCQKEGAEELIPAGLKY